MSVLLKKKARYSVVMVKGKNGGFSCAICDGFLFIMVEAWKGW